METKTGSDVELSAILYKYYVKVHGLEKNIEKIRYDT